MVITINLIIGPLSCLPETCEKVPPYFAIHGLNINNVVFDDAGTTQARIPDEQESISWSRFFIHIGFEKSYHAKIETPGGQNLYALSCLEPGHGGSKIGVDTIYIITLHDYNARYRLNDTLNSIVLANYWTTSVGHLDNFFPLSRYTEENEQRIAHDGLDIRLAEPPGTSSAVHEFKVVFRLVNGETFEETSRSIRLSL